jgi:superfamily I DNA and RNA helicase
VLDIIFGEGSTTVTARALLEALRRLDISGTLYLGYPVLSTADSKVLVDALLVSSSHGLVAFDLSSHLDARPTPQQLDDIVERQNQIHASMFNKLNTHRDLRSGRNLAVTVNVISCYPTLDTVIEHGDAIACPPDLVSEVILAYPELGDGLLRPLNAAIQRVSTLRPPKRRDNVTRAGSRGAVIKQIEREIANLDQWQNRGAIEYANGPQRIRGLAGSGKTVVLALKAAYLHARHPEWRIAVTFQSRALYQQFRDLIRRFIFDQIEDEPDWTSLLVMHAWGSSRAAGIYSTICSQYAVPPLDWKSADAKYGSHAFEGACEELNAVVKEQGDKRVFDAVLIDEAQDFPTSFYKMIYSVVPEPRRIMWAYDDLQNLGDYEMRSEQQLFGTDSNGLPRVTLRNEPDMPKEDIVLPVCYRNTPWALATAHALGFGIYRAEGLVQMFGEPTIWPRVGYEVVRGTLDLGSTVAVRRSPNSYPSYFSTLVGSDDAIVCREFASIEDQYSALAEEIAKNLAEDELEPTDILVVLPNAITSRKSGAAVMTALAARNIPSHLAGVTTSRDEIFQSDSIAITHIFRAKGNEAPMVYVVNADFCQSGFELSRKRNILFTAITRSRCWVRLFGVGAQMKLLCEEVEKVRSHSFELEFLYPDKEQLKHLAHVHRDMTEDERSDWESKISVAGDVIRAVMQGELPLEALPADLRDQLGTAITRERSRKK